MNAMKRIVSFAALVMVTTGFGQSPLPPEKVTSTYKAEIAKYRAWRMNDDKMNWATLAGLFWLKPGTNTFGTAADNALVLPKGSAPAHAGRFEFKNGEVNVTLDNGVAAKFDGKPATSGRMMSDKDGDQKPTLLELNKLQMKVIQRGSRTGIRLKDLDSPNVKSYREPPWYPADRKYHIVAKWEASDGSKTVAVPNVLGDVMQVKIPGTAHFKLNGQEFALVPFEGDPAKTMEFMFSDATTGGDTYPAGRMFDVGPVKDGKVVIDFNESYSPPCAVTPYATCPIAPKENRMKIPVLAGEKFDKAHHTGKVFNAQ